MSNPAPDKLGKWLLPASCLVFSLATTWQTLERIIFYSCHGIPTTILQQPYLFSKIVFNFMINIIFISVSAIFMGAYLDRVLKAAPARFAWALALSGGVLAAISVIARAILQLLLFPPTRGIRVMTGGPHYFTHFIGHGITFTLISLIVGLIMFFRSGPSPRPGALPPSNKKGLTPIVLFAVTLAGSIPAGILIAQDRGGGCSGGLQGAFTMLIWGGCCILLSLAALADVVHTLRTGARVAHRVGYVLATVFHAVLLMLAASVLFAR